MWMRPITQPTSLPLTLEEAKLHLRVDNSEEDGLINGLIQIAIEHCENYIRKAILIRNYELVLDKFPQKELFILVPMPPIREVVSFEYYDTNDVNQSLTEDVDFTKITNVEPGVLSLLSASAWPDTSIKRKDAVRITLSAGCDELPAPIKHAVLLLVAHFYENREAVTSDKGTPREVPFTVNTLLSPYRLIGW